MKIDSVIRPDCVRIPRKKRQEEGFMISVSIPGWGDVDLEYLVVDYNGTLAFDGKAKDGVKELLEKVSRYVKIFIVTADTYGNVDTEGNTIGFRIIKVGKGSSGNEKAKIVRELGPEKVVAIGNGSNDALMLREAALGIGVIGDEGCASSLIKEADIVVKHIVDGLNILLHEDRIVATLRD
jgi:P-type E1-E2 ATPase